MIGITWLLVWIGVLLNLLPKEGYHQSRKHNPRAVLAFKRKVRTFPQYFRPRVMLGKIRSCYYDICIIAKHHKYLHYVILSGVIALVFIVAIPIMGLGTATFGSLSLLAVGSAVQPFEILGTGVVEASQFGNGDDLEAIQLAIDYARTNSKPCVYVGPGTWDGGAADSLVFDGATSDWNGITFKGAGRYVTTIDFVNLNGDSGITFSHAGANLVSYPIVSNMRINGNANANYGIDFDYSNSIFVENVYVTLFSKPAYGGIHCDNVYAGTFLNFRTYGCYFGAEFTGTNTVFVLSSQFLTGEYGVWQNGCYDISYMNCSFEGNASTGLYLRTAINTMVRDCYFEENVDQQIYLTSTTAQYTRKVKIEHCYMQGGGSGPVSTYGVLIDDSHDCVLRDNHIWNHVTSGIYLANTADTEKSFDITIEYNWYSGNANNITVDANAYRTVINENAEWWDGIVNGGHFTITPDRDVVQFVNNSGAAVATGDNVTFDNSDASGKSFTTSTTINDKDNFGVVYDGGISDLTNDANAGQKNIIVDDIYMFYYWAGRKIIIRDDSNQEECTIDSIDTATSTITVLVNLTNAYTTLANARVLMAFDDGEYCNIITKGQVEYLHADGTIDISIGSYLSNFSVDNAAYKGYDYFKARALEAYAADNTNGLIAAEIISLKESYKIDIAFVHGLGTATTNVKGWDVNAALEGGVGFTTLPDEITECLLLKINGSSRANDADGMALYVEINAGADNELQNTHTQAYSDVISDTLNFAVDDVMTWTIDTGILVTTLTGGDNISVQAKYNAAVGANVATSIYLRNAKLYCV